VINATISARSASRSPAVMARQHRISTSYPRSISCSTMAHDVVTFRWPASALDQWWERFGQTRPPTSPAGQGQFPLERPLDEPLRSALLFVPPFTVDAERPALRLPGVLHRLKGS
jgi:hypothetical protein